MTITDRKYPDLAWDDERAIVADRDFAPLTTHEGVDGLTYTIFARDGYYWLSRYAMPAALTCATAPLLICRTDVRYHDDAEIVRPA